MHIFSIFLLLGTFSYVLGAGAASGGSSAKAAGHGGHGSESTKLLRTGRAMALECKLSHDKDVDLNLQWFKDNHLIASDDDHYKIFAENSTLLILAATEDDVGMYRCQTTGFTPNRSFNVSIVFLQYKNMPKSMTVLEGDKLVLTCDVEGKPMPFITWLKDDVDIELSMNESRFSLEPNDKGTDNATLLVPEAIYDDRALYACVIMTADISYNTTIFVRVKDMYAALWPFLGICAEVFILCLIIFIYEKRRAKNDFEESDTDQPTEQKPASDSNKDSVRQRK